MGSDSSAAAVLALTSVAAFMGYLDVTIVNVSFPAVQHDFSSDATSSLIWVLDIYSVVLAGLLLVVGRISDLLGHRRMFLLGLSLFTTSSALCAVAPSLGVLIAARGFQAAGAAIFTPSSLALILRVHDVNARPKAVATWTAAAALAAAVGPALGGCLTGEGGTWRWIFIVNVPVGVTVVLVAARRFPLLPRSGIMPGLGLSVSLLIGTFLAALAITRGRIWGWDSTTTLLVASASLLALGMFVVQNQRSRARILDSAFVNNVVLASNATTFFVSLAFFAYLLSGVLFLNDVWGYSVLKSGLVMSPAPVCAIPAALLTSGLSRRRARMVVLCGSALITLFGWVAVNSLTVQPHLALWLGLGAVLGIGIGATLPLLSAMAVEGVGEARFATASALNSTVRQFAAVLAFATVGTVLSVHTLDPHSFAPIWVGIAVAGVLAASTGVVLRTSPRVSESSAGGVLAAEAND